MELCSGDGKTAVFLLQQLIVESQDKQKGRWGWDDINDFILGCLLYETKR